MLKPVWKTIYVHGGFSTSSVTLNQFDYCGLLVVSCRLTKLTTIYHKSIVSWV